MKETQHKKQFLDDDIVAFSITGKPINISISRAELASAQLEIKKGEIISQEDLEKESEDW